MNQDLKITDTFRKKNKVNFSISFYHFDYELNNL